jgi:hypothetical protein
VVVLAVAAAVLPLACGSPDDPVVEAGPVSFSVAATFDSLIYTYFVPGSASSQTAREAFNGSMAATLVIDSLDIAPTPTLTITSCGAPCFGETYGFRYGNAGRRNGDSIIVTPVIDVSPVALVELAGVLRGDSIVGKVTTRRSTSTTTWYTGTFIARRKH